MRESKKVLVTGSTGFLGSHLVFRLLEQGHRVHALARRSRTASGRQRVEEILVEVAGAADALNAVRPQLTVVEGDIADPGLGLAEADRRHITGSIDEVWHCAASLSFAEEDREEIFRTNVDSTRNVIALVEETATRRFQHVSTAYVAGNRPDVAKESEIDVGQTFKNPYEESKCRSELLLAEAQAAGRIVASVYRPSIVIGDSRTGRVTHFHGVYAFIRGLWSSLERLRRRAAHRGVIHLPLRVLGSTGGSLNFVPIDYVIDGMLAIAAQVDSVGRTYHLTNPEPTPNSLWLPQICRVMGVEGLRLVGPEAFAIEPMTKMEQLFQKQMSFYYQYLQGEPRFDCSQTLTALQETGIRCPKVTVEFIEKMTGWYLDYLNR
jgi:nucleoside-diphosphate-sugar epimerase